MSIQEAQQGTLRRLNWGCGQHADPGWINSDRKEGDGIIACDILEGLPLEDSSIDYAVSIHALPEIHYVDLGVPRVADMKAEQIDSYLRERIRDHIMYD